MPIFNFFRSPQPDLGGAVDSYIENADGAYTDNVNIIRYKLITGLIIDDESGSVIWNGVLKFNPTSAGSDDPTVVIPSALVEVYARTKPRGDAETPLSGISYIRSYHTPCLELPFSDFIAGRNALSNKYLNDLGLNLTDWNSYVAELIAKLSLPTDSADRKKAVDILNRLLKQTNLSNKVPRLWVTNDQKLAWVQNNLPKELFKLAFNETVIPLVRKAYPTPEVQYSKWISGGEQILVPICDDYKGVCCLYDEIEKEIAPGLFRKVRVYKDCMPNVDKAVCLNQTKEYSQSASDATPGQYYGAEFFNDDDKKYGCELCKSPTSIVYCLDGVAFIHKNLSIGELKLIINNSNNKTDIKYFATPSEAQAEYNKRTKTGYCTLPPLPQEPSLPPTIALVSADNNGFDLSIVPASGCNNNVNYIHYDIYINGTLETPEYIQWDPPGNSPTSSAIAHFIGNYIGDTIYVKSSNCVMDESTSTITCAQPKSVSSNSIVVDPVTPLTSPPLLYPYNYNQ